MLIELLKKVGTEIVACDPVVVDKFMTIEKDVVAAAEGADALVLITDHDDFHDIDFESIRKAMKEIPVLPTTVIRS